MSEPKNDKTKEESLAENKKAIELVDKAIKNDKKNN